MTLATLRTSKWVLRTILALAFVVFCLVLAVWQWERSQDELAIERAALAEPIPVGEALTATESTIPLESLGRQVRVVGPVLSDAQTLVRDRTSDTDSAGYWVVVGVEAAPNEVVPVLLGWTPEPELPELTGDLAVTGRLQPDENFYPEAGVNAGQPLLTITKAGLTQLWVTPGGKTPTVTPGFVAAQSVSPAPNGVELVTPLIGTDPDVGLPVRNVLYSLQWLVLAGFAIFMWIKWFREDVAEAEAESAVEVENRTAQVSLDA